MTNETGGIWIVIGGHDSHAGAACSSCGGAAGGCSAIGHPLGCPWAAFGSAGGVGSTALLLPAKAKQAPSAPSATTDRTDEFIMRPPARQIAGTTPIARWAPRWRRSR